MLSKSFNLTRRLTSLPLVSLVIAMILLGGCGSSAPSLTVEEQVTRSSSAVQQADDVGARELAPLAFREAQKKLTEAERARADGDAKKAMRLAEQAEVDAELAEVEARSTKTQQAAKELRESIRTLREEIATRDEG